MRINGQASKPARQRHALPGIIALMRVLLWRSRRSGRTEIELHRRRLFRTRLRSEERFRRKTEHSSDQICRETAPRDIVALHRLIKVATLDGNSVLGSFQLRL